MFWACSVSSGRGFDLMHSTKFGQVLHLSHIVLHDTIAGMEKTTVLLRLGKKNYPLAHLSSRTPMVRVDLYVNTEEGGSLVVEGKGKVSVFGYFELELQLGKRRKIEEANEAEEENYEEEENFEENFKGSGEFESSDKQQIIRTSGKADDEDTESESSEEIEKSEEVEEESSESINFAKKKR